MNQLIDRAIDTIAENSDGCMLIIEKDGEMISLFIGDDEQKMILFGFACTEYDKEQT